MATDNSHRVIMGKRVSLSFLDFFFIRFFSYLQVTIYLEAWMSSKFGRNLPQTTE